MSHTPFILVELFIYKYIYKKHIRQTISLILNRKKGKKERREINKKQTKKTRLLKKKKRKNLQNYSLWTQNKTEEGWTKVLTWVERVLFIRQLGFGSPHFVSRLYVSGYRDPPSYLDTGLSICLDTRLSRGLSINLDTDQNSPNTVPVSGYGTLRMSG